MTDNEIIKALECCSKSSHFGECFKNQCPLVSENGCKVGKETLYPYLLDIINRQKEEIEELKKGFTADADFFASEYDLKIKYEAIKEFAKQVKMAFYYEFDELIPSIMADKIDNLVKEMTEVNENEMPDMRK